MIAEWLNENGIYARVESSIDGKIDWVNFGYDDKSDNLLISANLSIVDGGIRVGGHGKDRDIPLALPDSLERLVTFIKSRGTKI